MISICMISFIFLFLISFYMFLYSMIFIFKDLVVFIEWELVSLNSNSLVMSILLDWMSLLFMSFVLFISSMVIYYSEDYMFGDLNLNRFIMLVLMFILSMMFLIISPNLISILLGWDGLGLVSYCLVIYYQNIKSYNAGMLTALMNRVGDVMLLISISWFLNYGSWNFYFYLDFFKYDDYMKIISLLIILAAMTKSAQIPFSSWLPAAMAAPTPVSALVHSSTLVTAGVYLLIRFNNLLFNYSYYMVLISCLTMFMAGIGANYEFDLKKIIALSTLSQLGLMMGILYFGMYKLAFFHLLTHALFKALLFMCAGSVIHDLMDNQDIRNMGNLFIYKPLSCICFNISNLALCGFPFLAGFYSKDLILEYISFNFSNILIFFFFTFSAGLTVSYSFRLLYYSILGDFNFNSVYFLMEKSLFMLKAKFFMLMMVIFMGSFLSWMIFPSMILINLPMSLKLLVLFLFFIGLWMGLLIANLNNFGMIISKFYSLKYFLGLMWFLPNISTFSMNYIPLMLSFNLYKNFDQGWNEYFGAQGLFIMFKKNSLFNEFLLSNNLKIYLMLSFFWLMILMIIIYF
uniref:NADH-ubiquinone oxidoreductase chain 5 n=1 Tax=Meru phyllisae TaxID=535381 RepID=S4SV29_9COLE|nr:NADH dehydrogenase subunit 5 [Meru phyllisae]